MMYTRIPHDIREKMHARTMAWWEARCRARDDESLRLLGERIDAILSQEVSKSG